MTTSKALNFIDLFSGAGGISCGLQQAGFQCLLGVDMDSYAIETFRANHPKAQALCQDLRALTAARLRNLLKGQTVHVVVGGPPCQGFSTVGRGDPQDQRNHLFSQFLRIVKLTRPHYLIIENVTGLLAQKNEPTLMAIIKGLGALGHRVAFQVLSAEKYGVAERRRRTIILASRVNDVVTLPPPTHSTPVTVGEIIGHLATGEGDVFNHDIPSAIPPKKIDQQRIRYIPEGRGIRYEKDERAFLPKRLRFEVSWRDLREGRFRQARYQRLDRALPSPTIMTGGRWYYHPTENRHLTAREAAKIQSFPNDFRFCGPLTAQWKQIGNAVPPRLAYVLGRHILKLSKKAPLQKVRGKKRSPLGSEISQARRGAFRYHNPPSCEA